ncbi:hypothetical protein BD414DRAFT_164329 [Trametes punicea]|nr:hypothetical protein BD414DRAFT_164329 [Trametes punicea]
MRGHVSCRKRTMLFLSQEARSSICACGSSTSPLARRIHYRWSFVGSCLLHRPSPPGASENVQPGYPWWWPRFGPTLTQSSQRAHWNLGTLACDHPKECE